MNTAPRPPQISPSRTKFPTCGQVSRALWSASTGGIWKMARYPSAWWVTWKTPWVVTWAITLASTTGVKLRIEKSCRITSSVNRTPPKGALKIALMPAAVPHPVRIGMWLRATRNVCPTPLAMAAPICTIGPSAPVLPAAAERQGAGQRLLQGRSSGAGTRCCG